MMKCALRAAGVGLAGLLLAACGSAPAAGPTSTEIDRDATLTVGWAVAALPLDPDTTTSERGAYPYISPLYDRLVQMSVGADGLPEAAPMIATSWKFADDSLSVVFTLRSGMTFSDGVAVDAQAVKTSLDRARTAPKSTGKSSLSLISSVDVLSPTEVRISTTRPASDLLETLAGLYGSIISPAAINNPDLETKPVGSGPYVLSELKLGDSVTYTRRAGYWDPEAQKAAKLVIRGIVDANTRLSALRSGQIDVMSVDLSIVQEAQKLGAGFDFYAYPVTAAVGVYINVDRGPLKDPRVRQALSYALDRPALAKGVVDDACTPNDQPMPAGVAGYLDHPPVEYGVDPARAKALLAEAGYPNGFDFTLITPAGLHPQLELAAAIQAQFAAIGVRVEVIAQDSAQMVGNYSRGGFDALVNVRNSNATPAATLNQTYLEPRLFPGTLPDPIRKEVLKALDPNLDPAAAKASLEAASAQILTDALTITICSSGANLAYTDKVVGVDRMGMYFRPGMDVRYVGVTR